MKPIYLLLFISLNTFCQTKVDTTLNGFKVSYYENGNPKNKIQYVKGKPNGFAIAFYDNKVIKEIGTYSNNRWVGDYRIYFEDGQIQQHSVFDNTGKRLGIQRYYHKNGIIAVIGFFTDGKELLNIEFDQQGTVASKNLSNKRTEPTNDEKELMNILIEIVQKENKEKPK